ncbi:MAG: hypothetical protein QM661_00995 [Solimonas sp.]
MSAGFDIDRIVGAVALIVLHEVDALAAHGQTRARRARSAWQVRDGVERRRELRSLSRQTRRRRQEDHAIRRELWIGLLKDLRSARR